MVNRRKHSPLSRPMRRRHIWCSRPDIHLSVARGTAVEWVVKTSGQHGFSVQSVLLAVNYPGRCFLAASGGGLRPREDKPWMGRLAAVACLSLASSSIEFDRVCTREQDYSAKGASRAVNSLVENESCHSSLPHSPTASSEISPSLAGRLLRNLSLTRRPPPPKSLAHSPAASSAISPSLAGRFLRNLSLTASL
ncbi:Cyclin-D3-2 [Platanthera zijinensis]|uniref:Cyclin-D3-2 n=1 Tax=Platanthera zijinensis TaxID=2320716 RepID=A0AAP0AS70_9ASPA